MTAPENAEEIQQEIEQTREHLGQTVEQLAAKADVKARARAKAGEMRARAQDKAAELSSRVGQSQMVRYRWPLAVTATGLLAIAAGLVWRQHET
jgi:succinyl-CoA synthetase beta subunit